MITQDSELLTVDEAARSLSVSQPTIRRWVKSGRLHAIRVGPRRLRVRRRDVDRMNGLGEAPESGHELESDEDLLEIGRQIKGYLEQEDTAGIPWLTASKQHLLRMLEARGGKALPSSVPLIRAARDEGYDPP